MNSKRIARFLICLVLICALLVNISPVKARADAVGALAIVKASTVTCNPYIVCAALLIACGVYAGVSTGAFENIVYHCVDGMEIMGKWIKDGGVELLRTVDEFGNVVYYAAASMFADVTAWVGSNVFTGDVSTILSSSNLRIYDSIMAAADAAGHLDLSSYCLITFDGEALKNMSFFRYPPVLEGSRYASYSPTGERAYAFWYTYSESSIKYRGSGTPWTGTGTADIICGISGYGISLSDLRYGNIPFSDTFTDGTSARAWSETYANRGLYIASGGSQNPDDGGEGNDGWKFLLPLCLTTLLDLFAMSQADQWTADTPPEFSEYEEKQEYEVTPAPEFEGYPSIEIKPVTTPDVDPGGSGSGDDGSESGDGEGTDYTSWFQKLIKTLEEIPTKFSTWFTAIVSFVQQFPTMFEEWMAAFPSLFESWLSDLKNFALDFPSLFEEWINNVIGAIQDAPAQIEQWINGLPDRFAGYFENVQLGFASVVDAVTGVGEYIVNGIRSAITDALSFLFEPEEGFIESKVQALSDEFTFVSSIIATGKALTTGLSGVTTSPPIIYVDLGASNGSYNYGGKTVFMDLSWYAEYKPTVDIIISAFLWICFIWRLILKLPGIINGMPGDFVMGSAHLFGLDNHLPSRNAAYEIQRAENRNSVRRGPPK